MYIDKVLKYEKKALKKYYMLLISIAITLPIIVMLLDIRDFFYISYLLLIEALIIIAIIAKINWSYLQFSCTNNKLRFKSGLFNNQSLILCNSVAIVHTYKMEEEMEIVIVTTVNLRNKKLKPITKGFLKKYPDLAEEYIAQKELEPEKLFYYQIIKKGGLKKYSLLDTIYKNCVKAIYTDDAIQNIKIARGQAQL